MPQMAMTTNASNNEQRGNQAEFLADDGKNKIGVVFRDEAELLAAVAEAEAGPAAGAERNHGLVRLITDAVLVLFQVPPAENAPQAHRVMQEGNRQAGGAEQNGRNNIFPADPGDEQHRAADGGEQDGGAAVRFNEDQAEHQRDERAGKNDAAFPGLHLPLVTVAIPRQQDDERDFCQFGRLKAHAVEIEPAARAIDFPADVRDEHQHEQKQRRG